ncbi:OPT family oligopeptide transporter [Paludibacter jiangxiensis]|uniref:Putative oligopeptide transporter, OPT family n=1 Tax=Paludibacter jiangxiensis TaxID=681398 RepID=A0A161LG31_9BACT|nr:oligopeptide transporter, OPT family [Paludibacter jiangxiensis]GAT63737.1 putative oligopeptide transporter, OPT family [Paludibacter jiangxiensis]
MANENKPFGSGGSLKEFTLRALLIGLVLAVVLGAANAYLGLGAGMTIAATYPAAVLGMAVLRMMKKSTILEENFTRTVGSIGESVAAGAIFTLPAFYITGIWKDNFSSWETYLTASLILIAGGILGILFVALMRRVMVEDKELPFPESQAAAEIHKAGQKGASGSKFLFYSMIVGGLIKLFGEFKVFAVSWSQFIYTGAKTITGTSIKTQGGFLAGAPKISAAYFGVGYIIGPRLASLNFSGSILAWGLFIPIIMLIVGPSVINDPVYSLMAADGTPNFAGWEHLSTDIWKYIVRMIAIGGMLVAAFFTLYNMRSSLFVGLKRAVGDIQKAKQESSEAVDRTEKDLKFTWVMMGIAFAAALTFFVTYFIFNASIVIAIAAASLMVLLAFFLSAVSGYLVGIIGSSSNPISGLTVTVIVVTGLIFLALGITHDTQGVAAVLGVAAIVAVAVAVAGEMFQDLKAGHILKGTPWKMQIGDIIGVVISGLVMFGVLILLNQGDIAKGNAEHYVGGFGSKNLTAPQAGLFAVLSNGIIAGKMVWALIITGMLMGVALILMKVKSPMLIFVGMYLPLETVAAIFLGGLFKGILDHYVAKKQLNEHQKGVVENTGVLMASGLIAGEALMGLVIAIFAIGDIFLGNVFSLFSNPPYLLGLIALCLVGYFLIRVPLKTADKAKE